MISFFLFSFLFLPFSFANHEDWKDLFISSSFNYTKVSSQCTNDTKVWLNSLQLFLKTSEECVTKSEKCDMKVLEENVYAVQQLDSFGRLLEPGLLELRNTFEGDYNECERINGIKYKTNYCYMSLYPKGHFPASPTGLPYKSAVCMPRSCQNQDLPILYNQLGSQLFTARAAFCVKQDVPKDSAFWGFTIFMGIMIIIAITASFTDFIIGSGEKDRNSFLKILLAFSFWTNASQILSVKEQKPEFIKSLDCIRTFSMSWVLAGHSLIYFIWSETSYPLATVANHIWNHLFLNAVLSVDTFFLLSGVVVSYLFFKQRPKSSQIKSPITWIMFYVHRYLRLTPPYMLFIGFFVVYGPYIQGPFAAWLWNVVLMQIAPCKYNWWRNLLYINNYDDQQTTCYGVSWYLAVDTQLYFLAPVVLIVLYYSFTAGTILIVGGCAASVITTYILYGVYDLPADSYKADANGEFTNVLYQRPWIRCTPYLVGILTGYLIATYGKRSIRLNWAINLICWLIAFGIGFACLFSNYDYDKGTVWSSFSKATFYNFSRLGWSIAVAWVIIANHFGWGGPVNAFMSHPIWQPFGRLSYCAYIVHWMVLWYFLNIGDRPLHFYNVLQVYCYYAIPATALSYFFAFFWSCLFEVSTLKLEKMLIDVVFGNSTTKSIEKEELKNTKTVERL